jgi:hypothetical protein
MALPPSLDLNLFHHAATMNVVSIGAYEKAALAAVTTVGYQRSAARLDTASTR